MIRPPKESLRNFPLVPLGEVLKIIIDAVPVDPSKEYPMAGVYSFGRGLIIREPLAGSNTTYRFLHRLHVNDFVISKPKGWEGALARVTKEFDGKFLSPVFPTFRAIDDKLEIKYLEWYCKQSRVWEDLLRVSRGIGARRETLYPERFLELKIPLPPLTEQQRIVARIEELATKIEEARGLKKLATEEAEVFLSSWLESLLSTSHERTNWEFEPLHRFAEINPSKKGVFQSNIPDEVSFVPMSAVDDITGTIKSPQIRKFAEVSKGYTYFVNGDVIFARITPCMQNGKAALVTDLRNGVGFGSTEFHVIRPGPKVSGGWIYALVRQKQFRNDAGAHFKGTAGQQRVPESFLVTKIIPVPPLDEQRRIIAYLDGLQSKVDTLKKLQEETQKELNAMIPSVLDKAFKGEL